MSDRVAIFGSRTWANKRLVALVLFDLLEAFPDLVIVHGDCATGADAFAEGMAKFLAVPTVKFPALWYPDPKGPIDRSAGPRRNRRMARSGLRYAVGFRSDGDSRGTDGMRGECRFAGVRGWFFCERDDIHGGSKL